MARMYQGQVAIGLDFNKMLEWTFTRGTCLRERIEKEALTKIKTRDPVGDYDNLDVTVHGIECDLGQIEVVFNMKERAK